MAYTVKNLAKISGVSVRTLHFYDEVGLLKPAHVGENGYRYYEEEELFVLQQILFFKELGFALIDIQRILKADDFDKIKALKSHRNAIEQDAKRMRRLLTTIDKTIAKLQGGEEMKDADMYRGFDPSKQQDYERELVELYGEPASRNIAESKRRTRDWTKSDYEKVKQDYADINKSLVEALERNEEASSLAVQEVIAKHFQVVSKFYTPTRESYIGLARLYLDHLDFRKLYEGCHPSLATFITDAMKFFAEKNLKA